MSALLNHLLFSCFGRRRKPKVLQLPITSRCNSRCKTCNVWHNRDIIDIDPMMLSRSLKDPFFSEVETVGINGGEFTLVPNFFDILGAVLVLPNLRSVFLISNGLFPKKLFEYLSRSLVICREKKVHVSFCLSVDGVGDVHNYVRGVPGCFAKTKSILDEMQLNWKKYCDSFQIGCTISKHNIGHIAETELFLAQYGFFVEYHLAVPNKRIHTFDEADYSVFTDDRSRVLAAEFFYSKYLMSQEGPNKSRYFAIYYNLKHQGHGRLTTCYYRNRDVTIDESLNLSLCATASDSVGNLVDDSATSYWKQGILKREEHSVEQYCSTCVHYSYYPLNLKGRYLYIKELMKDKYSLWYYRCFSERYSRNMIKSHFLFYRSWLYTLLRYTYHYICKFR